MKCKRCGSGDINHFRHGRDGISDPDLCDACYWRKRTEEVTNEPNLTEKRRDFLDRISGYKKGVKKDG